MITTIFKVRLSAPAMMSTQTVPVHQPAGQLQGRGWSRLAQAGHLGWCCAESVCAASVCPSCSDHLTEQC